MTKKHELFCKLGGNDDRLPFIGTPVFQTAKGTRYLKGPYVALTGLSSFDPGGIQEYLEGFDERLGFTHYLSDSWDLHDGSPVSSRELAVKHAGQGCYMSWGPKRTWNRDADSYLGNIYNQGHWSVLEHATYTFFLSGSRTMSAELNRHRGLSPSERSQRYVTKDVLRFVERPEFQRKENLHARFVRVIDLTYEQYEEIIDDMKDLQEEQGLFKGKTKTESKKNVQQASRALLLGCTETSGNWTGNARTWRHVIDARTRADVKIEPEIRDVMIRVLLCLNRIDSLLFGDYAIVELEDGSYGTETPYRGA